MTISDSRVTTAPNSYRRAAELWSRNVSRLGADQLLILRYVLVAGVIGVPASVLQLAVILSLYGHLVGSYGTLTLNALWLVNFELGLLRNFGLHCLYTWKTAPSRRRLWHGHVAAAGALVIDMAAFNLVVFLTGIIPLAQVFGAGSGFGFNFLYNKLKTFALPSVAQEVD